MSQGTLISTDEHGLKILKVYNENGRAVAFDVELSGDDVVVALNDMRTYQTLDAKKVNIPWWSSTNTTTLRVPLGVQPEQIAFELYPFSADINAVMIKAASTRPIAESAPIRVTTVIADNSHLIAEEDKPLITLPSMASLASVGTGFQSSLKWIALGAFGIALLVYSPVLKPATKAALPAAKRQNPAPKPKDWKAKKAANQGRTSTGQFKKN